MTNSLFPSLRPLGCLIVALSFACAAADAATIDKDAGVAAGLATDGAAWVGGAVPGSGDVAQWASASLAGNQTLDGAATWSGISVTDASATVTLSAGAGGTLGLGAAGIDLSTAAANLATNVTTNLDAAQVWNVGANRTLTITGLVTGGAGNGITKSGNGALVLSSGSNNFQGGITLVAGTLRIGGNLSNSNTTSVLGSVSAAIINIQGGVITTNSNRAVAAQKFNVQGDFTVGAPSNTSRLLVDTTLDLNGATRTITIDAGSASGGSGNIKLGFQHFGGSPAVLQVTNGTLRAVAGSNVASGSNAYLGFVNATPFTNNAGLILGANIVTYLGAANALGTGANAAAVTVEAGGTFDLSSQDANSRNTEVFSLSGSGPVVNRTTGTGTASLNISGGTGVTTYSGVIQDGATGKVALTKSGASTLFLTGASSFTGATNITGGNLIVNGSLSPSSAVTVSSSGVLGGIGSVGAVTVSGGGRIAPGQSIGTLSATSLTLNSNDSTPIGVFDLSLVDSTSDQVALGLGSLNQGSGSNFIIDFDNSGAVGQLYTLITFGSTTFGSASSFTAINGLVPGNFILNAGSLMYSTIPVPEPSTWALLAGLGALFAAWRRRKS